MLKRKKKPKIKNLLLLIFALSATKAYPQSPVTDFNFDISYLSCDYVRVHFNFEGSMIQEVDSCTWYFGDGVKKFSANSNGADHNYSHPGIYGVELVLWKDSVKSSIKKDSIIIVPQAPVPSFSYEASDTMMFAPVTVNFINTTQKGDGDSLFYDWKIENMWKDTTLSEENPVMTFYEPGTYFVYLTVSDERGCEKGYSDYIVVRDTLQRGEFDLTMSGCYGDSEISPCGHDRQYEIIDDTLVISGYYYGNCGTQKTVTVNHVADTIVVKTWETGLQATCSCVYCIEIKIPDIFMDSVIVNFNGELKMAVITGNREIDLGNNQIQVYPNPANDIINVSYSGLSNENLEYRIVDLRGVVKQSGNFSKDENTIQLNRQKLGDGFYLLVIEKDSEQKYVGKLLIN